MTFLLIFVENSYLDFMVVNQFFTLIVFKNNRKKTLSYNLIIFITLKFNSPFTNFLIKKNTFLSVSKTDHSQEK